MKNVFCHTIALIGIEAVNTVSSDKSKVSIIQSIQYIIQYTLANLNRGVSIKKKSVPISEFVRISEAIHLYGEFAMNHSKI